MREQARTRFMEDENSPQPAPASPPQPPLADGKFHHVDPNEIPVRRIGMAIGSAVIIAIGLFVLLFVALAPGIGRTGMLVGIGLWFALFPLLGIYSWVWPPISYRHTFFCLKEDCIIIRRGVFWKIETLVPKSRIQHTDIAQGPVQRSYEVSELIIHTAGTRYAIVTLSGLSRKIAPKLRNHLLDRTDDAAL